MTTRIGWTCALAVACLSLESIERRFARTGPGKEAIKRHWFVPLSEEAEKTN
jgi:hypothetical protein